METYTFVLCFALIATVVAFTIPDQISEYSGKDGLMEILESQGCKCKNGRCVTDNRGKTKCNCAPGYALQDEFTCEPCDCGELGKCMFIPHPKSAGGLVYQKKCLCDVGSAEKDGQCENCHCGENSKCEFEGDEKICYCIDGYSEKDGVCTECNCGFFGECKFEQGQKHCRCDEGYLVHDGSCKACNCGEFGGCSLNSAGEKVCSCLDGFSDNKGTCEKCDCGELSLACGFKDGEKNCTCKENRAQLQDRCVDCNCGPQSSGCRFVGDQKACQCLQGYVQKEDQTCREKCSASHPCQNGGLCNGGICNCLRGTSGEFCEIVDDCHNLCPHLPYVECAFNPWKLKRYCKCLNEGMGFDETLRDCRPTCDEEVSICRNGGTCVEKKESDYSRFCHCLPGTEGDFCEEIPGCYEKDCGFSAVCAYDVNRRSAFCQCQNPKLAFDPEDRTCKNTCSEDSVCENGGECVVGNPDTSSKFCRCLDGTKGDYCEKVPGCDAKDCGPNAKCVYDIGKRIAVCVCDDADHAFDSLEYKCRKICRDNSDCKNGAECAGNGGSSRFCRCLDGTDDDFCEKVIGCDSKDCGDEATCAFDVQTKSPVCVCKEERLSFDPTDNTCKRSCEEERRCQNGGRCISRGRSHFCECLPGTSGDHCETVDECVKALDKCKGESRCAFDVDLEKAFCECLDGDHKYDPLDGKCKNTCDQDAVCKNGGLCMHRGDYLFCQCKEGTSGTFCEIVDDCVKGVCGDRDRTVCGFDVESETVRCGCKDTNALYDAKRKECIACDCGKNAVSCRFDQGKKVCACKDGYADENGICKKKWCTENKCSNGRCEVIDEKEVCRCYEGYVLDGDYCRKLNCSRTPCYNGTCIVRQNNIEQCICPSGYTLQGGSCIRGVCRIDTCFGGRCKKIDGELMCVCPERFNLEGIGCFETVCKIQHCFGGKCVVKDDEEICTCPENHVLVGNVCKRILCEKKNCFGGSCNIVNGEEVCTCPPGFFLVEDVCREVQRRKQ